MNTGKISSLGVILLSVLGLSLSAQAESKRYLVKFKSAQTFNMVSQKMAKPTFGIKGLNEAKLFNTNAAVTQSLDHVQLLVIESNDEQAVDSLRAHPAIALIEEEVFHPAPQPMATRGASVQNTIRSANMETPWGIGAVKANEAWNTTKGNGARVLVLDTGLESTHPALASRFEKGRNFTGGDPADISDTVGHGTHVSGTVLADGLNGVIPGVAPEARLLMGKVCSSRGCSSVAIAEGINWSVEENVDVVNMSLGGWFITAGERAALTAAEAAGVFVAAASGNGGSSMVSYPAAFPTVLAVGATDINSVKADFSQWGPELDVVAPGVDVISSVPLGTGRGAVVMMDNNGKGLNQIKSLPFVGSPLRTGLELEVVAAGLGKPEDFTTIDVRGKFALVSRGEITFKEKAANAVQAGAIAVLIYNNAPGLLQGALTEDGSEAAIPAAMIEQSVGEEAVAALNSGINVRASLSIEATDYASFQGTSMATPHVAGVAALVVAANPNLTPEQIREVLKSTATPLQPNLNNEYGSGLVNAAAAVARAQTMSSVELRRAAN